MKPTATRRIGNTDIDVTQLGLGGAALGNLYAEIDDAAALETVTAARAAGISLFDTAPFYGYGLSEHRLGSALRLGDRDSLVISTKVGRLLEPSAGGERDDGFVSALPFAPVFDYSYDGVLRSFEHSLQRLGMSRIDVVLIHDIGEVTHGRQAHPELFKTAMEGGYRALDGLRVAGEIRAIGLGVNEWEVCLEALEYADLDCFLLAGRYTLLEQTALDRFLPECERRNISVIIGGPYNSGILATSPAAGARYDYAPASDEILAHARRIESVCLSHDVPISAAALQFPLLHPAVASVTPGMRSKDEVAENVQRLRLKLPEGLWSDLKAERLLHPEAPVSR